MDYVSVYLKQHSHHLAAQIQQLKINKKTNICSKLTIKILEETQLNSLKFLYY